MELIDCTLSGVKIVVPRVFGDDRGFFLESWSRATFAAAGLDEDFCQDNHSRSARGVLRGLHYQLPNAQGKLVRVISGTIFDVVVDLRRSSPTFGQWAGFELTADGKRMVWVPPGFAHGFLSCEDDTDVLYKCTAPYDPASEQTVLWDDPALAIVWPLNGRAPTLSAKDRQGKRLDQAETFP
ncbi:MAG: dTDP-4-dehydrorhamnose 3,5-epimerase [Novosphingobium sp.]